MPDFPKLTVRQLAVRLEIFAVPVSRWRWRWGSRSFARRSVAGGRKQLKHPKRGKLQYEHASFQANDDPGLKLVIYTPA